MSTAVTTPDEMRQPADWMRPMDDRILEVFREEGNMTPFALSREGLIPRVDTTRHYTAERCRKLVVHGMIEQLDRGLYRITDEGRAYLDEELDASTLDELDEPRVAE